MPICTTLIKVMQMHKIILLFCNTQVGLIVTILFHLFHSCNTLWIHWQYNIWFNSHMHYLHQSNANALDYFVVIQYSCPRLYFTSFDSKMQLLDYFDHIISNPSQTCITFIKVMQYPNDRIQISYPTIFTSTLPLLG
jgi:hypothetical protein